MIIALDAMGGDYAPAETVAGAIEAVKEYSHIDVTLVGREEDLKRELASRGYRGNRLDIFNATELVEMDESPSLVIRRKKDSSLRKSVELVKEGRAEAAISAGNSGAMMALGFFILGAAEGVERPALASPMPSIKNPFLLLDIGANVDCGPQSIIQFALMGNAYCKHVLGVSEPRVGLLNIGEEPNKGNELTKETFKLLEKSGLGFVGNVEPKEAFSGSADVVVCDGFTGNIFLKTSEGIAEVMLQMTRKEVMASTQAKLGYLLMRSALKEVIKKTDYDEYGGAPLLGLNGACIISHGRASAKAIKNGIRVAAEYASKKVYKIISEDIHKYKERENTVSA